MATSATAPMTNDGRATIERTLDVITADVQDYNAYFELTRCAKWITENSYKRIGLQIPDELLPYSGQVVNTLKEKCAEAAFCVMADASYASCCVDEITAEHWDADSIVHFGHACLSPSCRYPVLYVYGREPFDLEDFKFKFRQELGHEKVLVFYGVEYHYVIEQLRVCLNSPYVVFTRLTDPNQSVIDKHAYCARHVPLEHTDLPNYKCLYIGTRQSTLSNLVIALNQCQFYSYDPAKKEMRRENVNVNRILMKRFNMIERTKDARIVGIIAGAAGHRDYKSMVQRMKQVLKAAGKKYYTFVVGKLNVPKLANFMEIDVYVLLACHENALLESKDFYRPIVTPLEVELACNPQREWSQAYTTDFSQLLPEGSFHVPMPEKVELSADVSLVTGQISTLGTSEVTHGEGDYVSGTVTLRNEHTAVAVRSAGEFLSSRSWTGLEQKLGQTPVTKAKEGLYGIAREYEYVVDAHDKPASGNN